MLKPIWCMRCQKHSWTRQQLLSAWMSDKEVTCLEPSCGHTIQPDVIQGALERAGVINLDDDDEDV